MLTRIFEAEQHESIDKAASILAKAVLDDKLINVIGPGGHSNLAAGGACFGGQGACAR